MRSKTESKPYEFGEEPESTSTSDPGQSDRLWTLQDAANFAAVSLRTVERARENGDFPPGYRIGRSLRFDRDAIIRWAKSNREAA